MQKFIILILIKDESGFTPKGTLDGKIQNWSFLLFDDREFKILSGAIHYFRVQPEDWYHSLYNLKALGFNTVETYLPWNMHEPQKGVFNFQGILDIEAFLQTAQDLGLMPLSALRLLSARSGSSEVCRPGCSMRICASVHRMKLFSKL